MKPIASLTDDEFADATRRAVRALPDAPAAMQQAAFSLWPQGGALQALAALAQGVATRIAAALTFDSWATPAGAAAVRSLRSPTRHLLFNAQGRDIDLRISPSAEAYAVAGQILGPDDAGSVELAATGHDGAQAIVTQLDELGEFRIEGLCRGTYVMTLRMGNDEIVLPPVEVGEPTA